MQWCKSVCSKLRRLATPARSKSKLGKSSYDLGGAVEAAMMAGARRCISREASHFPLDVAGGKEFSMLTNEEEQDMVDRLGAWLDSTVSHNELNQVIPNQNIVDLHHSISKT
jgi:hypothetical protein